ncbi:MAG: hypothetical protein CL992_04205 [Euryarchaeota archaeon]|nr:hypothetical protein [Euryarchaeota archaeon]
MHKAAKVVLLIGAVVLLLGVAAAAWGVNQLRDFRYNPSEHTIFEGSNGSFDINLRNGYFVTVWVKGDLECPVSNDLENNNTASNESNVSIDSDHPGNGSAGNGTVDDGTNHSTSNNVSSVSGFRMTIRDSDGKTMNPLYDEFGESFIQYFLNFCDPELDQEGESQDVLKDLYEYVEGDFSLAGFVLVQHPVTGMPITGTYYVESSEEVLITDSATGAEELGVMVAWGFGGAAGSCCGFCFLFIGLIMAITMGKKEQQPVIIMQPTSAQPMQVGQMTTETPMVTVVDDGNLSR